MSIVELENSIDNLSIHEKADLVLYLLDNLDTADWIDEDDSFQNEIISRSKDDSSFFTDADTVLQEAKRKYI